MLFYPAALPLSRQTPTYVAGVIRRHPVAADRPFYSGKHRRHGMNLQVIATCKGRNMVDPGLPGTDAAC